MFSTRRQARPIVVRRPPGRASRRTKNGNRGPMNDGQVGLAKRPATLPSLQSPDAFIKMHRPLFDRSSVRRKLVYYDYQIRRQGAAGVITNYFFSANGCYDPNITGTGHQPLGFDELIAYYEQYTVIQSTAQARFVNNSGNFVNVGIGLTPDTTAASVPSNVENGLMVFEAIDGFGTSQSSGGERTCELTLGCDVPSYFGRKTQQELLNDTTLAGTSGANPGEQVYYNIMTWDGFFGSGDTDTFLDIRIIFDVIFWEPRQHAAEFKSQPEQLPSRIPVLSKPPMRR